MKPVFLIILDGWGIAPPSDGNAISRSKLPNINKFLAEFPNGELIASGESVGLPANEVGSTEVGHLTIGTGRAIYQGLKRVNVALEDNTFFRNKAFLQAVQHVKENHSKLHILGVVSTGNVHASLPHFYGLLELCKRQGISKSVYIHAFTDGRDAPPQEAQRLFKDIQDKLDGEVLGKIATVSGRFYAMDRDRRWERIQKVYEAIVEGKGLPFHSAAEAIASAYQKGLTDEMIEPSVIMQPGTTPGEEKPVATIDDGDSAIFFNFRIDRPRQLSMALTVPDFEKLNTTQYGYSDRPAQKSFWDNVMKRDTFESTFVRNKVPQNLFFVTMTNYQKNIPVNAVAFDIDQVEHPLGEIIADKGFRQLRIAESEKERFVSYYFNGYREDPFPGEERFVALSPKVPTYDRKPEMSTFKIKDAFKRALAENKFDFFVMNIAAPDMVAHTGKINATIKACEATDKAVGEMVNAVLAKDGTVFLTADHGHAEKLLQYDSTSFFFTTQGGDTSTDHSNNPVPFVVMSNELRGNTTKLPTGALSDIAPTILSYMGLKVPEEMHGQNLLADLMKPQTQ